MIVEYLKRKMPTYDIKLVSENTIDDVMELMKRNAYYSRTTNMEVTRKGSLDNITALPPNTSMEAKTYIAIYQKRQIIGILDFIEGYPDSNIGYIGLLMVNQRLHHRGYGALILKNVINIAKDIGMGQIELGCYEQNEVALNFWKKMRFYEVQRIESECNDEKKILIVMRCDI